MRILISTSSFGKIDSEVTNQLRTQGFEVTLNPYGRKLKQEESIELMKGVDAIIAGTETLNREVLSSATRLKYLCRLGVGMDNVDMDATKEMGIEVDNTPDTHIKSVAELALGGMLALLRHIHTSHLNVKNGVWKKKMGSQLFGKTVGLIGYGKVSKYLANLLKPFGVNLLVSDPYLNADDITGDGVNLLSLEELCKHSDIISLHIPYNQSNHHLINQDLLSLVKDDVQIINSSRGGLIDEDALYTFLKDRPAAGAYLDTYSVEPYQGKLVELDNILLTPHIGTTAKETRIEMEKMAVEKVLNFFKNV
ncbi:MAG: phosphoglycerate dehydrogenase [Bacteroidota bacterium]